MKLPTKEVLHGLRKGQRKRKLPRVFDGMWCSEQGVGGMKLTAAGSDYHVEWVTRHPKGKAIIKVAAALGVQASAWAWNGHGHRVVARLAETELTPKTQAAIQALLALETGATLESVSTWADEHRNPATAAWHY